MLNRCGKTGQGAQGHVFHMLRTVGQDGAGRLALVRRVLQKLAMSSAEARPPTCLLQKASKASFRALWNRELLLKLSVTYCITTHSTSTLKLTTQLCAADKRNEVSRQVLGDA